MASQERCEIILRKCAVVTGGTDGIGKEIARGLVRRGAHVIVVGRDREKGARAEKEIREGTESGDVDFLQADLSLIREANRLTDKVAGRWPALHYLVHSAGIVRGRHELTEENIESNFAVNYVSRFAITNRLLPLLEAGGQPSEAARVVLIGGAARNGTIYFDDVNLTSNFGTLRAVGQFCQANDVFTVEMARRLEARKRPANVTIACLKIGVVKTNIRREFPGWMKGLVPLLMDPLLGQTPQEAAGAALKLLQDKEFEGVNGTLYLKIKKFKPIAPGAGAQDPENGKRLWELSERLTGTPLF